VEQKASFKNLVHNGVDFYVQNALKLTYEHLQFQKFSGGDTSGPPLKGGGEGVGRKRRVGKRRKGSGGREGRGIVQL